MVVAPNAPWIDGTAKEFVNGQAENLPSNVPECLVNTRDCRAKYRAAAIETPDVHQLIKVFYLHRIAANDEILQIQHAGHRRCSLAFQRRFSPADHSLIGFQLDEDVRTI